MSGLTSATYKEVRSVLLDCGPLGSDMAVNAVFSNPHLKVWRNRVPSSYSPTGRADLLIDFLHNKGDTQGQNALALFLFVLGDDLPEGAGCREQLLQAAAAVARETGTSLPGQVEKKVDPQPGATEFGGEAENRPQITVLGNYYAGDHRGDNVEGKRQVGDRYELSGDFRGASVNVKSHIETSRQMIEGMPGLDQEEKAELAQLMARLERALARAPTAQARDVERIARRVEDLVEEANTEQPDMAYVESTANNLKKAAEDIEEALPAVLAIATAIVRHVHGLG